VRDQAFTSSNITTASAFLLKYDKENFILDGMGEQRTRQWLPQTRISGRAVSAAVDTGTPVPVSQARKRLAEF
jgi:hypothetical protein